MRIYVLGKIFCRYMLFGVILLLALPLLYFYARQAVNPLMIQHTWSWGEALTVCQSIKPAEESACWPEELSATIWGFYKNGF